MVDATLLRPAGRGGAVTVRPVLPLPGGDGQTNEEANMPGSNRSHPRESLSIHVTIVRPKDDGCFRCEIAHSVDFSGWEQDRGVTVSPTRFVLDELDTLRQIFGVVLNGEVLERWGGALELDAVDVGQVVERVTHPTD